MYILHWPRKDVSTCMNWRAWYRVDDNDTRAFWYLPAIFLFAISLAEGSIKNISKDLFPLIRSSTKIVEFYNVKFPKIISAKDGIWREFLETDSSSMLSKKWVPQKREFSYTFYQSMNYNNLVIAKHIYVSANF